MTFKGRRRGMEVKLALEKTTACANQPCTVQKADFPRVSSAPLQCFSVLQYFLRATVLSHSLNAQTFAWKTVVQ
jgi:hypothetical protein